MTTFTLDGREVVVADESCSLAEALRDRLGARTVKDGCSPQGQCGCCTVLVDGQPRVSCVTPLRRVAGRSVTTVDGLPAASRDAWADAFLSCGASQCGFCTPGIIVRLEALLVSGVAPDDTAAVDRALLAHLCRCTGWRTILDAWRRRAEGSGSGAEGSGAEGSGAEGSGAEGSGAEGSGADVGEGRVVAVRLERRDLAAAGRRATLEGRAAQVVGAGVALGQGGFAEDTSPPDALVAVPDGQGGWSVAETLAGARAASGKVQGRRTTEAVAAPLELPAGDWDVTLQTSWVEPAYLEVDAAWCRPGGEPASVLANGGAFGGKVSSPLPAVARELADRHGRAVRVLWSREDAVRLGPKRPPLAAGVDRRARRVVVRVARTPGIASALAAGLGPDVALTVDEVDVAGPPTSPALRGAGWAEGVALRAALDAVGVAVAVGGGGGGVAGGVEGSASAWAPGPGSASGSASVAESPPTVVEVHHPEGGWARAECRVDGSLAVRVDAGEALDEVVLRSYCIGAAHMALSWVTSEGLAVDGEGTPVDLTIRSFGVLRAVDTPPIDVVVERSTVQRSARPPVNGSDAVFGAVAAAVWAAQGFPPRWPTGPLGGGAVRPT